ncbi:MAG: hypothetical protein BROFUL_02467 [Candidatus Brocadia fulgida]|uniref:Uncharacterized protein n=1 Tax=Candidatus Brocadia fulgida TaxID=380242 RepID=A0A0M2UUY8_9BACT|nr:MAG: hypothetical protein BROFUL_02467 [Candidatus Brocadia fulgida]
MKLLFPLVAVFCIIFLPTSSFAAERGNGLSKSDHTIYTLGEQALRNLDRQHDADLLRECMGFYIDNQQFDNPEGSYNKAIRIGYQILNIDRKDIDTYTTMAWLLWSKWVSWTINPTRMPDGEGKADQAVELLNWGKQWNLKSERFYKESADTIWPLAKHYRTDLYGFVIENYRKADLLAKSNDLARVRIRLNLGHAYRQINEKKTLSPGTRGFWKLFRRMRSRSIISLAWKMNRRRRLSTKRTKTTLPGDFQTTQPIHAYCSRLSEMHLCRR